MRDLGGEVFRNVRSVLGRGVRFEPARFRLQDFELLAQVAEVGFGNLDLRLEELEPALKALVP